MLELLESLAEKPPASTPERMRIAVVNSICVKRDAISEAVRGTMEVLNEIADVRLFVYSCDFPEIESVLIKGTKDLLLDHFYNSADIIFYHFGAHYDFFNTILVGNEHAKKVVYFHSVTPRALMPLASHVLTDKALAQRANISVADHVLVNSSFSRNELISIGIEPNRIEICPLYVKFQSDPKLFNLPDRSKTLQLLYVGRFVESKGVSDLLQAVVALRDQGVSFQLNLAGNLAFSDAIYLSKIRTMIIELDLKSYVSIEGDVSEDVLHALYQHADLFIMPSYHEGFCVPILEALHAGCIPIAYNSSNLPSVVGSVGILVETGYIEGLSEAILSIARQLFSETRVGIELKQGEFVTIAQYQNAVTDHLEAHSFARYKERTLGSCNLSSTPIEPINLAPPLA